MVQFAKGPKQHEEGGKDVGDAVREEKWELTVRTDNSGSLRPTQRFWLLLLVQWKTTGRFYTERAMR